MVVQLLQKLQEIQNEILYCVCTRTFDKKVIDAIDKTYGEEIAKCYDVLLYMEAQDDSKEIKGN